MSFWKPNKAFSASVVAHERKTSQNVAILAIFLPILWSRTLKMSLPFATSKALENASQTRLEPHFATWACLQASFGHHRQPKQITGQLPPSPKTVYNPTRYLTGSFETTIWEFPKLACYWSTLALTLPTASTVRKGLKPCDCARRFLGGAGI